MMLTLFILSLFGGFLSGLIGLGGAVVMIPLMLTVPPLVGVGELSMKAVSGLSMIQVLFSSTSGLIIHRKNRFVHMNALYLVGIPMGICSLIGSYFSRFLSDMAVMILFAALVLFALVLLFLKKTEANTDPVPDSSVEDAKSAGDNIPVNKHAAVLLGSVVGVLAGVVGAGGGFIMIPLLMLVLKLPLRITVGTSLGIVFIGALFGSFGKLLSLQVDLVLTLPVVAGSLIASQFGARVSKKTPTGVLRAFLIGVVVLSLLQVIIKMIETSCA